MEDDSIRVSPTCVRVPVMGGHSESCNIEFASPLDLAHVKTLLNQFPGITVIDNPEKREYPMPLIHAKDSDEVFVGRIRLDQSKQNSLHCWIVSDNLRKGAATNAVQIAELLIQKEILPAR